MKLSMLLLVTLSVATLTLAKPTEIEAPSKLAVVDGVTSSSHVIYEGIFQSSVNTIRWNIRLDPRSRIDGFVIENLRGCRITGVISGIGDWDLTLDLEQIPQQTMFFQYRFYGTMSANSNQLLSEVMEPRVQVTTEVEEKIAVVDGVTSSSDIISSGSFQASPNTFRWSIGLAVSRIDGFVIYDVRGGGITGIISGIGDRDLILQLEKFPQEPVAFFRYRFYGIRGRNFNQLLSEVMEPHVQYTSVE